MDKICLNEKYLIFTEVGVFSSSDGDRTIMVNADNGTDDDSCGAEDKPCASLMYVSTFSSSHST